MSESVNVFFHEETGTASYLVVDSSGKYAVIIDSVLNLDMASGKVSTSLVDQQIEFASQQGLHICWILETHAHADHLSAAAYLKSKTGAKTAIGEGILDVQDHFSHLFPKRPSSLQSTSGFDRLLRDQDCLVFGESCITVLSTPGHTDDSVSYLINDNVFVGDTLFMPDGGTARCDFPGGNAAKLWTSIAKIHQLPEDTRIWVCHDYQPGGREVKVHTTVAESKRSNIHINLDTDRESYIEMRNKRDKSLAVPRLLYPSLQVNLWGGSFPDPEENGIRYLCVPLTGSGLVEKGAEHGH